MLRVSYFPFVEDVAVKTCPALGAVGPLKVTVPLAVLSLSRVIVVIVFVILSNVLLVNVLVFVVVIAAVDVIVDVFVPSDNTRVFLSRTTGYIRLCISLNIKTKFFIVPLSIAPVLLCCRISRCWITIKNIAMRWVCSRIDKICCYVSACFKSKVE